MVCPKCGGKPYMMKCANSKDNLTFYRKLACQSCKHTFYTAEIEVPFNDNIESVFKSGATTTKKSCIKTCVKVRCIDFDKIFESVSEAARYAGVSKTAIYLCCQGRRGTAGNLRWEYYKENEKEKEA